MDDKKLRVHIGSKIKEFRKRKNITQGELGKLVGVKNNTISAYERGIISTDQDVLFKLSDVLEVNLDDFFPQRENIDLNPIQRAYEMDEENELTNEEMMLIRKITEKALSLESAERKELMNNIKFAFDFFEKDNKWWIFTFN